MSSPSRIAFGDMFPGSGSSSLLSSSSSQASLFRIQMLCSTAQAIAPLIANFISLQDPPSVFQHTESTFNLYSAEESSLFKVIFCGSLVPSG